MHIYIYVRNDALASNILKFTCLIFFLHARRTEKVMKAPFELFEVLPGRYNIGPKINHLWDTLRYIPVPLDRLVRELLLKIKWFPTLTFALHRVMKPTLVLKKVRTTWTISVHIAKSIWCFNHCWESPIYGQQKDRIQWTKKHMVKKVRFLIFVLMRKKCSKQFHFNWYSPQKKINSRKPKNCWFGSMFLPFPNLGPAFYLGGHPPKLLWGHFDEDVVWVFAKIMGKPPNHPHLFIGFCNQNTPSIFGVFPPIFGLTPNAYLNGKSKDLRI